MPGFSTFEREGVELTGSFTATINGELRVGALEETVTVTGESPIVDVQSARRQQVLSNDVLKAIPTVRSYNALVVVVPGVVTNTNDVATGTATTQFPIHGGRNNEGRMTIDGLNIGNPPGGNQPPGFSVDVGNSEEISFTTSGGLGESETAGLVMNVVPKTGGNTIHGSAFYSGSGKNLQADNTEGIPGIAAPTPLTKIYDLNGAVGGPILQDKLWYFATARTQGSTRVNANMFYNLNAGDPTKWLYLGRTKYQRARLLGPHVGEHQRAYHVAGHPAQQVRRVLGRAVGMPELRRRHDRYHDSASRLARGHWSWPDTPAPCAASHLELTCHESIALRCRLWRDVLRVGELRARG